MVRTKAGSISTKASAKRPDFFYHYEAVGAKAPQKVAVTAILSGNAAKGRNHSGGNSYHPRETPCWQKPITFFMKGGESSKDVSKEEEEGITGIVATKSSKQTLEMDMDVEVTEEPEVTKKKLKVQKSDKPIGIKKIKEKKHAAKISKDSEEEEDQGILGISATDSPNKILEAHDDMEVEEAAVDAETANEKVKKEESKEIEKERKANKDEGENKENEFKKVDTTNKKDPEIQREEDQDKENQFNKDDIKKTEATETKDDDGKNNEDQLKNDDTKKKREPEGEKDKGNIQNTVVPKNEQTESKVFEESEPGKKEDPKEEKIEGKQDDKIEDMAEAKPQQKQESNESI